MDCREVKNKISEYIDGRLTGEEATLIREHLDRCASCLETVESMTRLIGLMQNIDTVDEPETILRDVKARLEKRAPLAELARRLFSPPKIKIPLELAGAALVVTLIMHMAGVGGGPKVDMTATTEKITPGSGKGLSRQAAPSVTEHDKIKAEETERPAEVPAGAKDGPAVRGGRSDEVEISLEEKSNLPPAPAEKAAEVRDQSAVSAVTITNEVEPDAASLKKGGQRQRVLQDEEKAVPEVIEQKATSSQVATFDKTQDMAGTVEKEEPAVVAVTAPPEAPAGVPEIRVKIPARAELKAFSKASRESERAAGENPVLAAIRSVEGKVIDIEHNDETDGNVVTGLKVEIPADSLAAFMLKLGEISEVEGEYPLGYNIPKQQGPVTLRILLQYSR